MSENDTRRDDSPENVALAHRQCNVNRNVGGEVQLRLVG